MTALHDVVIPCWDDPADWDLRARKIATFLGVEPRSAVLGAETLAEAPAPQTLVPSSVCQIVAAETLARAAAAMPDGVDGIHRLTTDVADHVFAYGFQPTDSHAAVLSALSDGALRGVAAPADAGAPFRVTREHRHWCGQFTGLSVEALAPTRHHVFVERGGQRTSNLLIGAGDEPFFVRTQLRGAQVFLAAADELADLDAPAGRGTRVLSWFSGLAPLMMFLRGALGNRVWHNENPKACFIVDDPLLSHDRYGFLDYQRLAESTSRHGFAACIAFIPWNYRRSRADVAALFSSDDRRLGLCVHGCDHTRAEFATTHAGLLRSKARLALERMAAHRRLSGARFDQVMVFPQGLFSEEAVTALSDSGYLAAVNSDVCPSIGPGALVLRDLLDVAVTKCADFPLFGRRYPRSLADFAFDLFLGKPVLAVEHHGYFRHGYAELESFVAQLNALDERLEWADVGSVCSSACLTRNGEDDEVQVRFYTNRFRLENRGNRRRTYSLLRRHTSGRPMGVAVNGLESEWQQEGGSLNVRITLAAGETADVSVLAHRAFPGEPSARAQRLHALRVGVRRRVSEFRDNHVDTNAVLSAIATGARHVHRALTGATAAVSGAAFAASWTVGLPSR